MSAADLCAFVYSLLGERVMQERQVAAMLRAAGESVELPSLYDFDVAIGMVAEPNEGLTPAQKELGLSAG